MKVVALQPIVGCYPVGPDEPFDYVQNNEVVTDTGDVRKVRVAYASVRASMAVEAYASPGDIQDDQARVAKGEASWMGQGSAGPIIRRPGVVTIGAKTIEGDGPGINPEFDLPDDVARRWAEQGLVEIVEAPPKTASPPSDPRVVRKVSITPPAAPPSASA